MAPAEPQGEKKLLGHRLSHRTASLADDASASSARLRQHCDQGVRLAAAAHPVPAVVLTEGRLLV